MVVALMRLAIRMARLLFSSLRACAAANSPGKVDGDQHHRHGQVSSAQPSTVTEARSMIVGSSAR